MGVKNHIDRSNKASPRRQQEGVAQKIRKWKPLTINMAIAVLVLAAVSGVARADMASDIVLANTCFSCHGTDGNSAGAMPTIKGKSANFIEQQLVEFRDDRRSGTVMNRIAKGFTSDEIRTLARYFSGQQ